ncbi:hypothetical protein V7S43_007178 [Phytophthora oleae]|uniref:Uncharacterized protein n=1 Tax=Phytophthora oleae TaxID=2107226 RepID=A0ABD3FRI5_9STRA
MATSSADNTQAEPSEDATQPPYQRYTETPTISQADDERKRPAPAANRRLAAQRVRTVRITTQIHPDMVIPYLYGERGGRSLNAIVNATGCTVDYCALSPGEPERSPCSHSFIMNFLVSAQSSESLEEATKQLRKLVDKVQVHLQKKARVSRPVRAEEYYDAAVTRHTKLSEPDTAGLGATKQREAIPDERWADEMEEGWGSPPMQRVYYASGGPRVRREQPRYVEVTDVEANEKRELLMPGRRTADATEAAYMQRGQSPTHFVRRRVRRYPDQSRWMPMSYTTHMRNEPGYAMYAVPPPQAAKEQVQRISRPRQPRHIYQEAPNRFAPTEYGPYEYDGESNAEFPVYDEAVDLTDENAGANDAPEFVDATDPHEPVRHPRRSLKRPLNTMRSDGTLPPPIYRQRMPYIYDYAYDEEDEEWRSDDEDMAVGYRYPPPYRNMDVPIVRRRRRFDSTSSPQWSSPAGRGHQQIYKRRKIPREDLPVEQGMLDEAMLEIPSHEHIIRPPSSRRKRAAFVDHLDEVAESATINALPVDMDTTRVPADDGSTSLSETPSDDDVLNGETESSPTTNEHNNVDTCDEVFRKLAVPATTDLVEEKENTSPNDDLAESIQGESDDLYQSVPQSEVEPLERILPSDQERLGVAAGSPTRKSPDCPPHEDERRIPSLPPPVEDTISRDASSIAESSELPQELAGGFSLSPQVATVVTEIGAERTSSEEVQLANSTAEIVPPVATYAIQINNHVMASLERLNKEEASLVTAKSSLSSQEETYRRLERNNVCRRRLEALCCTVYELQCKINSPSCTLEHSRKRKVLGMLDSCLEKLQAERGQTLQEKVDDFQDDLKQILAMDELLGGVTIVESDVAAARRKNSPPPTKTCTPPNPVDQAQDNVDDPNAMDLEDDGWFEEPSAVDPVNDSEEHDNFVAQISPQKRNLNFEVDFLAVKLEDGDTPRWPRQLPPFVWSLLARVRASDPQSYVMRVTHKRLLEEIAKGDPYYYLHPTTMSNDEEVSSPSRSTPSQPCEFGCRGASALKWERKLVSQISSRMKSFDNVAYSLARSSGGKEVLNRKKMNSIIRKLHLVAMQLHSLVSHLYCVKGEATCKEVDSLPIALNNSYFERKMGVYKSRLKLVVPHKYQQQQQPQAGGTNEPAEELLRDTYEFFPELLLCVDIWGYNYREGQVRRHNSKNVLSESHDGGVSEGGLFPLSFFRGVESLAFDFEHDSNGLLRCICDELLNIVCLWNDFKWTDNLEAVALERVVSFEADVTGSILKILELYAHHLQALWAVRLLDDPDQLRRVHFTQFNAYYSDRSQGGLNSSGEAQSRVSQTSQDQGSATDSSSVDRLVANEMIEQRLAEEYWNRKVTALSIHSPDDDAMGDAEPKSSQFLDAKTICAWDQQSLVSYLLRWSDVYSIRSEVNALSVVTNHMLKHEVQNYRFATSNDADRRELSNSIIDAKTKQLVAAVSRAQMLIRDVLIGAEKLALHSASSQLPGERKQSVDVEPEAAESERMDESEGVQPTASSLATAAVTIAQDQGNVSEPTANLNVAKSPASDVCNYDAQNDVNIETDAGAEQPELKDLIQLLAVTKQDVQDVCGHRPRSARMREKVQTQSVQLARQTVEIFRNIRNMYGSQRR